MHEHASLAAAGAGDDQRGFGRCSNGLTLCVIQFVEDRGDIHWELMPIGEPEFESAKV